MTSILEPFLTKKNPNETGTVSIYANVNNGGGTGEITTEGITSSDGNLSLKFIESQSGYTLELVDNSNQSTLFSLDELGNINLKGNLTLSNGVTSINRVTTTITSPGDNNTIATNKAIIDYTTAAINNAINNAIKPINSIPIHETAITTTLPASVPALGSRLVGNLCNFNISNDSKALIGNIGILWNFINRLDVASIKSFFDLFQLIGISQIPGPISGTTSVNVNELNLESTTNTENGTTLRLSSPIFIPAQPINQTITFSIYIRSKATSNLGAPEQINVTLNQTQTSIIEIK